MMGKTVRLKYNSQYTSLETAQRHKNSMGKWCFRMVLNSSMGAHVLDNGEFELLPAPCGMWNSCFLAALIWSILILVDTETTHEFIFKYNYSPPNQIVRELNFPYFAKCAAAVHIQLKWRISDDLPFLFWNAVWVLIIWFRFAIVN